MKYLTLILFLTINFVCSSQVKYWEVLSQNEKDRILRNPEIPGFAIDFYSNDYDLNKDNLVLDFLEKVALNKNKEFLPLYYFLFIKMCEVADGYIGEVLGKCGLNILSNHTDYVLYRIREEIKHGDSKEYDCFKDNMAFEYYASGLERRFPNRPNFDELQKDLEQKVNSENRYILTQLLSEVKQGAKEMIEKDK